jgi:ribosomal protein S18 acetylase RimI-like enzyme
MRLFAAALSAFRQSGGEQLYIICENEATAGRAFVATLGAQRMFSEYRMEQRGDLPVSDDDALVTRELRPGDDEELIAAAQITSAGFARSFEQTLRSMREDLTHGAERSYLALTDSQPVGSFKLYSEGSTTGIYGFTVDPARQRQGWGRRMLTRASALARAQGAARVTLEVETSNERAIALYISSGFVTITTYGYYLLARSLIAAGR